MTRRGSKFYFRILRKIHSGKRIIKSFLISSGKKAISEKVFHQETYLYVKWIVLFFLFHLLFSITYIENSCFGKIQSNICTEKQVLYVGNWKTTQPNAILNLFYISNMWKLFEIWVALFIVIVFHICICSLR
jgi:hypothetical protein